MAAFYAATASTIATHTHCGIFSSPRLEAILNAIGRRIAPGDKSAKRSKAGAFKKVLHVGSELSAVGGLTRMISRWMDADSERTSSLVLTQHRGEVPEHLTDAIQAQRRRALPAQSVHRQPVRLGSEATADRQSAMTSIILHIHCEDVIPVLAFADESGLPPVLFLNHADHLFWLGTSVADLVLNLRDAADRYHDRPPRRGSRTQFPAADDRRADDATCNRAPRPRRPSGCGRIRSCFFPSREGQNTDQSTE